MSELTDQIESLGYKIRKDGIFLGKDGFSMPDYLSGDPYSVDVDFGEGDVRTYRINQLVAAKYMTKPEGAKAPRHKNQLQSDSSVDNLEWT
jgi:hypothetical protein